MASQNERYQKMLMDKVALLEHEKTVVQDYVSSLMMLVDKAKESSEKFMKISVTSKKFMKKFQEANSSIDTALTSLIKVSNLFASLNDESNSSSESDTPSEREGSKGNISSKQEKSTTGATQITVKDGEKVPTSGESSQRAVGEVERKETPDETAHSALISRVHSFLMGVEDANSGQPPPYSEQFPPAQKVLSPDQLTHVQAPPCGNVRRPSSSAPGPPRARTVNNISGSTGQPYNTQITVDTQSLQLPHGVQGPLLHSTNNQSIPLTSPLFSSVPCSPNPSVSSHAWSEVGALQPSVRTTPLTYFKSGDQLEVMISHVVSPSRFWIQNTQSEVVQLMSEIRNFYNQENIAIPIPNPHRGLICCAQFSQDMCWYRAQITGVHHPSPNSPAGGILVDVFYIDYGNSERISAYSIRSLHRKFSETPPQAVCCSLAEVVPPRKNGQWTETETSFFTAVTYEKVLQAQVVQPMPHPLPSVSLSFLERKELEEGVFSVRTIDIANLLVSKRLAKSTKVQTANPSAVPVTAPLSAPSEKKSIDAGSITDSNQIATDKTVKKVGKADATSVKSKGSAKSKAMSWSDLDGCSTSEQDLITKTGRPKREIKFREELPLNEGRLLMAMTYIVHPNEFYVHLITPDALELDTLTQNLQDFYSTAENLAKMDDARTLGVGDFCCAKFERDKSWYRGKILEIKSLGPKGGRKWDFMVFYVDFGNSEWVLETNVKPLADKFFDLPAQALKCSLSNIHPRPPANKKAAQAKWSEQAIKTFTRLTGFETRLHGFVCKLPEDESKAVEINLSIITSGMDIFINQELVNLDLASSDILKKENEEDKELEIASTKWLKHHYSKGGYADSDEGHPESPNSLMDILEKLDPMAIHFNAEINSYGFDRDDPEMATMGYKSTLDRKVCYYHVSGKGCYRGENCKYEHPDPGDLKETMDCFCTNNVIELPSEESVVCVNVTAIYSPIHFWIQFVFGSRPLDQLKIDCSKSLERPWEDGETLESLNESMNEICNKNNPKSHDMILPALGEIVLARYSKDKKWYRSRVTFVEEEKVKVFHVDYGTSEWVTTKEIQPALPQFLHLPFQAVQCRLDGFENYLAVKEEEENARKYFEKVATGQPVIAHIIARDWDNLLFVELFNTSGEKDICINEELVKRGFYRPTVQGDNNE